MNAPGFENVMLQAVPLPGQSPLQTAVTAPPLLMQLIQSVLTEPRCSEIASPRLKCAVQVPETGSVVLQL